MRAVLLLLGLVLVVVGARAAGAQPVAVEPGQETRPLPPSRASTGPVRAPHGHGAVGGGVVLGQASAHGHDDGWLARLELEAVLLSPPGRLGGYFGYLTGPQLWKAGDDWGLGLPVAIETGVRAPGLRAGLLFGFEAIFVDEVAGDAGLGLYAPLGGVRVVGEWRGWVAGLDGRITRRWQIGADDHTQWQLGITVGRLWEKPIKEPYR